MLVFLKNLYNIVKFLLISLKSLNLTLKLTRAALDLIFLVLKLIYRRFELSDRSTKVGNLINIGGQHLIDLDGCFFKVLFLFGKVGKLGLEFLDELLRLSILGGNLELMCEFGAL